MINRMIWRWSGMRTYGQKVKKQLQQYKPKQPHIDITHAPTLKLQLHRATV
jgi:hypothetical protein